MNLSALRALARTRHRRAQLLLSRDAAAFARLHFLHAAAACGLLAALHDWTARDALGQQLRVARPELLDALLALGVALRELARDGKRYRLAGRRARAVAADDALEAVVTEYVTYHAQAYLDLPAQLAGAPPADFLDGKGPLIARSSRVFEPFMREFVQRLVAGRGPLRLLEIGCGSGVYLRCAAEANPQAHGAGIDLQAEVVANTARSLAVWGLAERFQVVHADVRALPPALAGPFDLITLYNNVYYFPVAERPALLGGLRARLAPGGALALTSMFQGDSVAAANFDLLLRATAGCAPLPDLAELTAQLRAAGFGAVEATPLLPGQPFYGLVARPA
jgi:SAM-dependent methyltransferase